MLRNVGRLDSLTRSIDGTPSDADLALEFNNPNSEIWGFGWFSLAPSVHRQCVAV